MNSLELARESNQTHFPCITQRAIEVHFLEGMVMKSLMKKNGLKFPWSG